jgi:putative flippase GtrA
MEFALMLSKFIAYLARNHKLILRFGLVGMITFMLSYFIVWLFYGVFALDYRFAITVAFIITVIAHFILNRTFTYKTSESPIVHQAWKYGVMLAVNYMINLFASIIAVEVFELSPYFGIVFATIITASSSFFLIKYFVFLQSEREGSVN